MQHLRKSMITVCHPYDEMELSFIVCILNREEIPYLIIGQHFGAIVPGIQIPAYNERTVQVPQIFAKRAIEAIKEFRELDVRNELTFTTTSKLRMLIEAILFGWFLPVGNKKPSNKSFKPRATKSGVH